jgi:prevent-host-death family protein
METITIHEAKTQLSRLIKKACRGEEIVIARGKEPVVKLVPITQQRSSIGWVRCENIVVIEFCSPFTSGFYPFTANPRRFCVLR